MPDQIQADYNQLEEVASEFTKAAQGIAEMKQRLSGSYMKLRDGGWIGEGANAFFQEEEDDVGPAVQRLQAALEQAGQTTQKIAHAVKEAEQEASSLFRP